MKIYQVAIFALLELFRKRDHLIVLNVLKELILNQVLDFALYAQQGLIQKKNMVVVYNVLLEVILIVVRLIAQYALGGPIPKVVQMYVFFVKKGNFPQLIHLNVLIALLELIH